MGAFYTVAHLPVDDSDAFCAWCLSDFEYEGETVMMAPASGFYSDPTRGRNEVRIAYVLRKEELERHSLSWPRRWSLQQPPETLILWQDTASKAMSFIPI